MPLNYSKHFGGRRFGFGLSANKHGVRPHMRFSFCGFVFLPPTPYVALPIADEVVAQILLLQVNHRTAAVELMRNNDENEKTT
jgi:hypothetical protein